MKFFKVLSLIPFSFGTILSLSANEYNFENIKFDYAENLKNTYKAQDKLDK